MEKHQQDKKSGSPLEKAIQAEVVGVAAQTSEHLGKKLAGENLSLHNAAAQKKRQPILPEISFTHVEMDEELPPGTQELVEEALAEGLFKMWLAELKAKGR